MIIIYNYAPSLNIFIDCFELIKIYIMVAVTPVEQFDAKSIPTKAKVKKSKVISIGLIKQNFECKIAIIFLPISLKLHSV